MSVKIKRIYIIIILVVALPVVLLPFWFFNCYWGVTTTKVYYIPEIETYIKVINIPSEDCGYIIFSEVKNPILSDSIDYLKVSRQVSSILVFDKNNNNDIYIVENGNILEINQVNRVFHDSVSYKNRNFFEWKKKLEGTDLPYIKEPYIELGIGNYLDYVITKKPGDINQKMKPIQKWYCK